jgi:hypothetical protein
MGEDAKRGSPEPPPRRNRAEPVSRNAAALSAQGFARAGFRDPTLVLHWGQIAGAEVARVAQPLRLSESPSGGVLTLKAEPGASLFLQHESRELCQRINSYLGRNAVARLRFVQGPLLETRPSPRPPLKPPAEPPPNDPASGFGGPEPVREALIKLARRRAAVRRPD